MNQEELNKEIKELVKEGTKPSDLKKRKSVKKNGDNIPTPPTPPISHQNNKNTKPNEDLMYEPKLVLKRLEIKFDDTHEKLVLVKVAIEKLEWTYRSVKKWMIALFVLIIIGFLLMFFYFGYWTVNNSGGLKPFRPQSENFGEDNCNNDEFDGYGSRH